VRPRLGLRRRLARAPAPPKRRDDTPEATWFWDHYDWASGQVVEWLESGGFSLAGREVADLGCGDGIIDLGIVHRARPARFVGFDVNPVDVDHLRKRAGDQGVDTTRPAALEFQVSEPRRIPADDASFDVVVTWSAFEHIAEPVSVLREARRILRPDGVLFLQLWPFYFSERGSHLWDWFPAGFHHLTQHEDEIRDGMGLAAPDAADWTKYMFDEFRHLNRITVDELQRALLAAGLGVRKFELETGAVEVTAELARYPLTDLGISGIKLLAVPT
jgi:ubiquinone/menaquinone biosynthesis C-methylase UbiE